MYDLLHNRKFFLKHGHLKVVMDELFYLANASATFVISQEYGVTKEEKITIASSVADNLFYKLHADLANASTGDDENGDTRLDADFIEVSENVRGNIDLWRSLETVCYFIYILSNIRENTLLAHGISLESLALRARMHTRILRNT